jgi:sulfate permease, SulP family
MPVPLDWLRGYRPGWLRPDLLAGLTVWAVLVPEGMAYATIAGVPPVVGLYAAVPALLLYAIFGSSRHLVVGPVAATAALSASIVAGFISEPVLKGFIVGLALTIIAGQLPKLAGIPKGEGNFFEQLWDLLTHLGDTNGWALLLGLASLAVLIALKERFPVVPGRW